MKRRQEQVHKDWTISAEMESRHDTTVTRTYETNHLHHPDIVCPTCYLRTILWINQRRPNRMFTSVQSARSLEGMNLQSHIMSIPILIDQILSNYQSHVFEESLAVNTIVPQHTQPMVTTWTIKRVLIVNHISRKNQSFYVRGVVVRYRTISSPYLKRSDISDNKIVNITSSFHALFMYENHFDTTSQNMITLCLTSILHMQHDRIPRRPYRTTWSLPIGQLNHSRQT